MTCNIDRMSHRYYFIDRVYINLVIGIDVMPTLIHGLIQFSVGHSWDSLLTLICVDILHACNHYFIEHIYCGASTERIYLSAIDVFVYMYSIEKKCYDCNYFVLYIWVEGMSSRSKHIGVILSMPRFEQLS